MKKVLPDQVTGLINAEKEAAEAIKKWLGRSNYQMMLLSCLNNGMGQHHWGTAFLKFPENINKSAS